MIKTNNFKRDSKIYLDKKGYSLIEALIYLSIFVVVSSVIISLIWSMIRMNRQVTPLNSISRAAVSSLEAINREIRGAVRVDLINSIFSTSTSSLELITQGDQGFPGRVKIYLSSGVIKMDKDNIYLGPLSPNNVNVDALTFNYISSSTQSLIKIEIDLSSGVGEYRKTENFYSSSRLYNGK